MKKLFYILIFIVSFTEGGIAQNNSALRVNPVVKYIKFYPNPAVSLINFEFQKDYDKSFTFHIYNFIGKEVYSVKALTAKLNIPLIDFYRGVYIYQLRDRSGNMVESGKFQVIK